MRFLLPALIAALVAVPVAANEVYRTVDERGQVVYSDRPLGPTSERVVVDPRLVEGAAAAAETSAPPATTPRQDQADAATVAAARAEQQQLMAEACRQARAAVEAYERSPRLYETLPDGGRRYLSEEEFVAARAQARQAVIDFCVD